MSDPSPEPGVVCRKRILYVDRMLDADFPSQMLREKLNAAVSDVQSALCRRYEVVARRNLCETVVQEVEEAIRAGRPFAAIVTHLPRQEASVEASGNGLMFDSACRHRLAYDAGLALIANIKRIARVPIVVHTGANENVRTEALRCGADKALAKSADVVANVKAIEDALEAMFLKYHAEPKAGRPALDMGAAAMKAPGESETVVNSRDGSLLAHIPACVFAMGDGWSVNNPPHPVELADYWLGIHCVTNRQYAAFVVATGHRPPADMDYPFFSDAAIWKNGSYPADKAEHPVAGVNWDDAVAYCRWAGGVLPTEAQWEWAARGPQGFIFPWGNEWDATRCRHAGNRGQETTCAVQDHVTGMGPFGTFNQAGNVREWCLDWYDPNYYYCRSAATRNPTGPEAGWTRVSRGGSWYLSSESDCRAATRSTLAMLGHFEWRYGDVGFRLAMPSRPES